MFDVLLQNLQLIGILILTYLASLGVNTLLGIYYNLKTIKEAFSKKKLLTGLGRGGIILLGGIIITAIISLLPVILKGFGISAENQLFENVSVVAMAGVLVSTIVRYLKDALQKFYAILGSHTEPEPEPEKEEELPEKAE
jgi:hypothetical protein